MRQIDVIYSPICEANGAFLGQLEEWLEETDVIINYISYNKITSRELEWYKLEGLTRENGELASSVFIDVFYNGKLIDKVPLRRERIESILEISRKKYTQEKKNQKTSVMSIYELRSAILENKIEWKPITIKSYKEEMKMCIENYPHGNPPKRFHKRCIEIKEEIFREVFLKEKIAGVYAKYQDKIIGLIEVFPREIIKKHGFLTGSNGDDSEYLTVGCLEVGYGIPRKEMIDELMFQLENRYSDFIRKHIEGIGVFEWYDGFTPYWVYDKYGFRRIESITDRKVVMEKSI